MRFAILTQNAPPQICGIGDHSMRLADTLRAAGHEAVVIARKGEPAKGVEILSADIGPVWLDSVLERLDRLAADHLVLQYTPLMFSRGDSRVDRALNRCWGTLAAGWATSLIVHETYFRVWWRPYSLVRGTVQKFFLRALAERSRDVFTASTPLQVEISDWRPARPPVLLPIGSNIRVAPGDSGSLRRRLDTPEGHVVLTLFGGGNGLRWSARLVDEVDVRLKKEGIHFCWLLIGGVGRHWFHLNGRVIESGWLDPAALSAHLQITDLVLMPHFDGISAKRGTLITALEHGLPVVGTRGTMTDGFWTDVAGVELTDRGDADAFAAAVGRLCTDTNRRHNAGRTNADYFRRTFTWPRIAGIFLDAIGVA